jgi:hypothetical protein
VERGLARRSRRVDLKDAGLCQCFEVRERVFPRVSRFAYTLPAGCVGLTVCARPAALGRLCNQAALLLSGASWAVRGRG